MPGKIKVKVLAGRNLPVMDRASDTTDAFVEIKFGGVTHKTDVCRKSLNPHWNSTEWYRFEVDESELQDEPLQLRLMDHDTYSANDAIGKVVISLAPLLAREANNVRGTAGPPGGAVMSGWIPVFDTMHGIRGELNVIVKVELFSDFNKYKTSSCGVQFFHCPSIPPGYRATSIHGFVEELVVNDDPEYQWIDKIRTPRASNEARQVAFIKLSNQVQRLVGLKAAELGANAVVGYQQEFDLEGEAGVVARAIGTAISITPLPTPSQTMNIPPCTQQQLKKCLDILATDEDSITDLSQYYQTHQEELQKMLSILNPKAPSMLDEPDALDEDDDRVEQSGRLSIHSLTGSMSLFQDDYVSHRSLRHLSEDQTDLNKLLSRKDDDDDDSDSSGPIQKIKKLKTNFFTKRFSKRKRDKKAKQDDQISIKSNSSDTSRISLIDIKNEFKKRFKKPKAIRKVFTNPDDEGVGMASILARSVIHAHTDLACITETQDSEHSTQEARRTSESEPNINVSDEDMPRRISLEKVVEIKNEMVGTSMPEIHFTSLKNVSSEDAVPARVRKTSESCPTTPIVGRNETLLKLPGDKGYFDSVSSALSGESSETYTSSEEDDESSDVKTDSEETVETTTSIVNSVLNHEVNPVFIAQMERKLTILENVHPSVSEITHLDLVQEKEDEISTIKDVSKHDNMKLLEKPSKLADGSQEKSQIIETSTSAKKEDSKPDSNKESQKQVEIHEPSTPTQENDSNPVKNIEPQEQVQINEPSTSAKDSDKCVQKPNMHHIKIHNPFAHKKPSKSFSAPSSPVEKSGFVYRSSKRIKHQLAKLSKSSMIKSISHYSLLPKKKEITKSSSHAGSSSNVPSRTPSRTPSDTVLGSLFLSYSDLLTLDKEGLQANRAICKSDEIGRTKFSMYIGSEPASRTSLSGPSFSHHHKDDHDHHFIRKERPSLKSTGLVHTAMETILLDKVDTVLLTTSPDPISKNSKQFFDDVSEKLEKHKNRASSGLGNMKMDQVQSSTGSTTPRVVAMTPKRLSDDLTSQVYKLQDTRKPIKESTGLVHTAIETMLLDKANAVLPESPECIYQLKGPFEGEHCHEDVHDKSKHKDHHFLSSIKNTLKEHHVNLDSVFGKHQAKKDDSSDMKYGGLVHTAMQTMLMDRAQSVIPDTPEPIPIRTEPTFDRVSRSRKTSETQESTGLVHNAMQTMLIEKIQSVLPGTSETVSIHLHDTDTKSVKEREINTEHSKGMTHSAMQTILMDKVQAVLPDTTEPVPIHFDNADIKSVKEGKIKAVESSGMIHNAMQTTLIDKVQDEFPDTAEPIPIHVESKHDKSARTKTKAQESTGLVHNAMQTMLMDKVQSVLPDTLEPIPIHLNDDTKSLKYDEHSQNTSMETVPFDKVQSLLSPESRVIGEIKHSDENNMIKEDDTKGLVHTAMETMLIDRVQTMYPNSTDPDLITDLPVENKEKNTSSELIQTIDTVSGITKPVVTEDLKSPGLVGTVMQTILMEKFQSVIATTSTENVNKKSESNVSKDTNPEDSRCSEENLLNEEFPKSKKLIRQDSIHSIPDGKESHKMSSEDLSNMSQTNFTRPPVLQHFHPLLSGLETIPSMSESSFERSLDGESSFETNSASVCDNSHAACGFGRSERDKDRSEKDKGSPRHARHESYGGKEPVGSVQQASLNSTSTPMGIHRRSSDSDLSVTPKGGSLNTSAGNVGSGGGAILRPSMNTDNLDMLEYPFLTMTEYPPGFIVHIGGTVCARAVKLVDGGGESAARAAWWAELRTELRAHARALRCNAVLAYCDTCSICEDVCVLSASGTAAVINLDCDYNVDLDTSITVSNGNKTTVEETDQEICSMAHVPYSPGSGPYRAELSTCGGCRRARVPAVLLATCAKPNRLMSYSKAVTLTAVAARVRRAQPSAEPGARDISDQLPFLEYELHKLLLAKLRMQGANALFSLHTQIAIGERCVMALASGTAVKLAALPPPTPPRIKASENDKDALEIQKKLWDSFTANKAANGYDIAGTEPATSGAPPEPEREEAPALDLCADKDACMLELDEAEDVETARLLCVVRAHIPPHTAGAKAAPRAPPHAFAQVSRARLPLSGGGASVSAERQLSRALDSVAYKLRRLHPAALQANFQLELPEDEIQLVVSGTAIPLLDPSKSDSNSITENGHVSSQGNNLSHNGTSDADDDIFTLDEEQLVRSSQIQEVLEDKSLLNGQVPTAVSLSTLSQITGVRIARRVCALRLLFVRETTAVRELGGLSGFLHTFTCEVLAIARAYTAALGGNALTSFYIRQLMLQDNAHKNQGQCLLSVGGDIVHITY